MVLIGLIALGILAIFVLLFIFAPLVAWIILGLVVLIIVLLLVVPIGADFSYINNELKLSAKVDGFSLQILPKKASGANKPPKEKKEKKPEKEKPKEPETEAKPKNKRKLDFTRDEILELLKKVFRGIGKFGKITVHKFMLHYVAGGTDPYDTAVSYNYVNAALSAIGPLASRNFRIKGDVDVWTDVDFTAEKTKIDARACVTIRLAQVFHMAFSAGFGVLGVLIKNKWRLFREKRKNKSLDNDKVINIEDNIKENIQSEERMDSHGQ